MPAEDPGPETLFATWLEAFEHGERKDFDAFCAEHDAHEADLRRLHSEWAKQSPPDVDATVFVGDETRRPEAWAAFLENLQKLRPEGARYRFLGEVDQGGMGAILKVRDESLRRNLAMKVILGKGEAKSSGATPDVDPRTLGRFLEEAQVTAQLDHPGIVPVHELGLDDQGRIFFTMKLIKGGEDLRKVLAKVRTGEDGWSVTRMLNVLLRACEAVAFAHSRGVLHRDLKPGNIMVGRFGEVYVMDWGLARVLGQDDTPDTTVLPPPATESLVNSERQDVAAGTPDSPLLTRDGMVAGTPQYMAPEQARGAIAEMGPHTDVYGMGSILYELLTGQAPYLPPGVVADQRAVWLRSQEGPPRPVRELAPRVPSELESICERAMARDIADRYRDMVELATDLRAYLEDRVVAAHPTRPLTELRKWVRRNRGIAVTSVAAMFVVLAIGVWAFLRVRDQRDIARGLERKARASALAASTAEAAVRREKEVTEEQAKEIEENSRVAAQLFRQLLEETDRKRLDDLLERANELSMQWQVLWGGDRKTWDAFDGWRRDSGDFLTGLEDHRRRLEDLRERGVPLPPADKWSAMAAISRERIAELQERWESAPLAEQLEIEIELHDLERTWEREARRAYLARPYSFTDESLASLHGALARFLADSLDLDHQLRPQEQAIRYPNLVHLFFGIPASPAETDPVPTTAVQWAYAIEATLLRQITWALLQEEYPDIVFPGLVPLGRDRTSGLDEYWHPESGRRPRRGADGHLIKTKIGSQSISQALPYFDVINGILDASDNLNEVHIEEYLISKYEMTQGQWSRLTGERPSRYGNGYVIDGVTVTDSHPVESVSRAMANVALRRWGFVIPSNPEWEYACRGGTSSRWNVGPDPRRLVGRANLRDLRSSLAGTSSKTKEYLDDGYAVHAPVDELLPNGFGLHHMHGNVGEYSGSSSLRGGSYADTRKIASCAAIRSRRNLGAPTNGLRPAARPRGSAWLAPWDTGFVAAVLSVPLYAITIFGETVSVEFETVESDL